jgi:hypothetical protein
MSGVSPSQEGAGTDEMVYIYKITDTVGYIEMESKGCITIFILGVDGEAELFDEELTDVGAALARGEVESSALVGVPDGGGDRGGACALLVERRDKVCK